MTIHSTTTSSFPPLSKHHNNNNNTLLIKLLISFLLSGLALRLLLLSNYSISVTILNKTLPPDPPSSGFTNRINGSDDAPLTKTKNFQQPTSHKNDSGRCDIFVGNWVRDLSGPRYTNETCRFIEPPQNCMRNGRPDSDYLHWKWSPRDCELPEFDAAKFLNSMRHKSWAFIGDSISRNHVQSLLCILSQEEEPVEVYHDEEFKSKRWHFPMHNFTLAVIWSPYLVKADVFEDNDGHSSAEPHLYLDKVDPKWSQQFSNFHYVIFAGGKWFLKTALYYENDTIIGCHYCPGRNLTELGYDFGYRKAIRLVLNYMSNSNSGHTAKILFRTTTPDHFENGEWFSGGTCNRTVPFVEGEVGFIDVDTIMKKVEIEEFETAHNVALLNGVELKLLDTSKASLLRPDGHPGPYRYFQPFAKGGRTEDGKLINDCLHWCLPGPIDYWNDMIMYALSH